MPTFDSKYLYPKTTLSVEIFAFNTKLLEMAMLASKDFTGAKKKLPPTWWSLDQGSKAYRTELVWHVLVSLKHLDPYI